MNLLKLERLYVFFVFLVILIGGISSVKKVRIGVNVKKLPYLKNIINITLNYINNRIDILPGMEIEMIDLNQSDVMSLKELCSKAENIISIATAAPCSIIQLLQSYQYSFPHFLINNDNCDIKFDRNVFVDTLKDRGLQTTINAVVKETKPKDIILLHDVQYEATKTVLQLVDLLNGRGFRMIYVAFDSENRNHTDVVLSINDAINGFKGDANVRIIMITDFNTSQRLIHQMHAYDIPRGIIKVLIAHGGWESDWEELVSKPRTVNLNVDVPTYMLKIVGINDELKELFATLLLSLGGNKTALTKESVYIAAAIYSQAIVLNRLTKTDYSQLLTSETSDSCTSIMSNNKWKEVTQFIKEEFRRTGVSPENLTYLLCINFPVNSKEEIFIPIRKRYSNESIVDMPGKVFDFRNVTLKLAVPNYPPYVIMDKIEDEPDITMGPLTLLFDHLSKRLNFNYKFVHPRDNEWGIETEPNNWTGAIKMLLEREADLAPFLMITQRSNEVIGYTNYITIGMTTILIQKPKEPPRTFIFLRPFSPEVWSCILISIPAMAIILYSINIISPYYHVYPEIKHNRGLFKFHNCLWYVYGAVLQQGGIYLPQAISSRLVISTIWLFVIVIISTYSGNLIAFLTFPEADWLVTSLENLAETYSIKVLIKDGSGFHQEVMESNSTTLQRLKDRIIHTETAKVIEDINEAVNPVLGGKAAFIEEKFVLSDIINKDYIENKECRIVLVPRNYKETFLSIGLRHGSPFLEPLNEEIQKLWNNGLIEFWIKKFFFTREECSVVHTTLRGGKKGVTLRDLGGAFYLYFAGLVISFVILLAEYQFRKRRKSKMDKDKKYNIIRVNVLAREKNMFTKTE